MAGHKNSSRSLLAKPFITKPDPKHIDPSLIILVGRGIFLGDDIPG